MTKPFKRLVLLAGMALMACNGVSTFSQWAENQTPQAETTSYRSEQYNFALDYPAGWHVEEFGKDLLSNRVLSLMSFELGTLPNAEYIPPEHSKIDILRFDPPPTDTFRNFIILKAQDECLLDEPIYFMLDNGGQAVELLAYSDRGGAVSMVFADLEGRYFMFITFGNLAPVQDIVRSLRLITPSGEDDHQEILDDLPLTVQRDDCYDEP